MHLFLRSGLDPLSFPPETIERSGLLSCMGMPGVRCGPMCRGWTWWLAAQVALLVTEARAEKGSMGLSQWTQKRLR